MTRAKRRVCVDCREAGRPLTRPAPHPGPRCATDWRAKKNERKGTARERRLIDTYDITQDEYDEIKDYQSGKCAICRRATGARKALAVDHDHKTGLVRGLLCSTCNKILGHFRDDPEAFLRGVWYLKTPPAQAVIGLRVAPIELDNLTRNAEGEQAA